MGYRFEGLLLLEHVLKARGLTEYFCRSNRPLTASEQRHGARLLLDERQFPLVQARPRWLRPSSRTPRAPLWSPLEKSTSRHPPGSQVVDHRQDAPKQSTRDRHLSHLEHRVAGVSDHLRADLHDLLAQRGQRPSLDLIGQNQSTEEVGQVIRQRMKLE